MPSKKKKPTGVRKRKNDDRDEEDTDLVEDLRRELAEKEAELARIGEADEDDEEDDPAAGRSSSDRKGRQLVRWDSMLLIVNLFHSCLLHSIIWMVKLGYAWADTLTDLHLNHDLMDCC